MTLLAIIDLQAPGSDRTGRAFLDRAHFMQNIPFEALERELGTHFVEPEDEARFELLENALSKGTPVRATVHPGESSPPEFQVFVHDPSVSTAPIFACTLMPPAVIEDLVLVPPHLVLETATLQGMSADTSPLGLRAALEQWARRVWPSAAVPHFDLP